MGSNSPKRIRCAVYARKSSEEGLDQDFNSLDAQREACLAYIQSQKSEGWRAIRTHYDDGGYSGGNLDRPALIKLLADIEAGKIDTVVVYKVDRLTRSLADFAKIVNVLDSSGASFVSVTQRFNTTTSMGRLTLNMLLSFAQFEREVTGERIRDRIAASKRKRLWMGGRVPLGYRAEGRTLEVGADEAQTVHVLFQLYRELGSIRALELEADRRGLKTKTRIDKKGRRSGGRPFGRGSLYHLLSSPIYVGRIPHKGKSYEEQHPAIIDTDTWETVQQRLAEQAPPRSIGGAKRAPCRLRGKLFDESGSQLTPSHTVKSGRRYCYYESRPASHTRSSSGGGSPRQTWRLPAHDIERFVEHEVADLLRDPARFASCARSAGVAKGELNGLFEYLSSETLEALDLVERVELGTAKIVIQIGLRTAQTNPPPTIRHCVSAALPRRGVERKLVARNHETFVASRRVNPSLVRLLARSTRWFEAIASGRVSSFKEIANEEGVSEQFVGNRIQLAFLSPRMVERICDGSQGFEITTEVLTKKMSLPLLWTDQDRLLT